MRREDAQVTLAFKFAIDPVAFSRPRFNRGRGFNASKYDRFKRAFAALARPYRPSAPLKGPLEVDMEFGLVPPLKARPGKNPAPCVRPDLDNYVKAVNDSLEGFFVDDGQIVKITARKVYAWDRKAYISVRIAPLAPQANSDGTTPVRIISA
jgi:Holliday junction resolvase RusA-like endonuclease